MSRTTTILDAEALARTLRRMAHEILENNPDPTGLALVGIPSRGRELSRRLTELVEALDGRRPASGVVDVSMHRDDLRLRRSLPSVEVTDLPLGLESRTVVLVDDVLFTGRTCRAAMDALASFGRPARIQLAVLIDRGHRELPICADYVGKNLPTARQDRVKVRLENVDGEPDSVRLFRLDQPDLRLAP